MIIAAIDLGTNTFSLSICHVIDGKLTLIHQEKEGVMLGKGGINEGFIAPDALQRALDCLGRFKESCVNYGVVEIRAMGTSAIRGATNGVDLIQKANALHQINITIFDGIQEANFIYQGIASAHSFSEPSLIMDIGGGSTEFIFADQHGIIDLMSFNIGISRIYQLFELSDPLRDEEIKNIEKYLDDHAGSFVEAIKTPILIGAAGSFETFYEMIYCKPFPNSFESQEIEMSLFKNILEEVIFSTYAVRKEHQHIIDIRKKLAPIAAIKTRWIINKLVATRIIVTPCSLKEGVLLS